MRMWGVNPARMCRQHLLGEHVELHMILGCLERGVSMEGYYTRGLVDTDLILPRHEALVQEMTNRGYRHGTPLRDFPNPHRGYIDPRAEEELHRRCAGCRERAEVIQ